MIRNLGIYANLNKTKVLDTLPMLLQWLKERRIQVIMSPELKSLLCTNESHIQVAGGDKFAELSDVVLAMGGDGTMLSAARLVGRFEKPLLGINLGNLGFLAEVSPDEMYKRLEDIIDDRYDLQRRMILEVSFNQDQHKMYYNALNDVVVDRGGISRLIQIHVTVDDEFFTVYHADGLIISTPTGSTAYSLASGGPIVVPTLDMMILNPICPHSLSVRPTVIPASSTIKLQVRSSFPNASVSIDGQTTESIQTGMDVWIKKADWSAQLITFKDTSYFDILRKKLMWGNPPGQNKSS